MTLPRHPRALAQDISARAYGESAHGDLACTVHAAHLLAEHTLHPELIGELLVTDARHHHRGGGRREPGAGHAVRGTTSSRIVERFPHVVNYTLTQATPQLRASAPM